MTSSTTHAPAPDSSETPVPPGLAPELARKFADALALVKPTLDAEPPLAGDDLARALNTAAVCSLGLGRFADAEAYWRRAIDAKPDAVEAYYSLLPVLKKDGRQPDMEALLRRLIDARPDYAEAHNDLGVVLANLDRLPEAQASYRRALALRPDYPEACYNLGNAFKLGRRLPEAEAAYRQALALSPHRYEFHHNLGTVLQMQERLPDAVESYRFALALRPDAADTHCNLGHVLKALERLSDAEAAYRQALALQPGHGNATFSLAVLLISLGRFQEGWRLYEARYQRPGYIHHRTRALLGEKHWRGDPLTGRSILVWQEDGLGDMIQFGRYFRLLKVYGAKRVTFACTRALHRLFRAVDGVDEVLGHEEARARLAGYDCWTSPLSLPLHLLTTADAIPPALPLRAGRDLVERWRPRLAALPHGRRIGLVWKGNPKHHNDAHRSLPSLATLAPLWRVPGLHFVSLQKGPGEDEAQSPPAGQPLLHLGAEVEDLADSAAVLDQLDLVICVDTAVAHLAASLGKPCWVMLPKKDPDWRWMHGRADSPWYPGVMRLFRQSSTAGWDDVVEQIRLGCEAVWGTGTAGA
ncbi:hypothetical protein CY652_01445 [Burkholderia sp. WAC0059]|uniref:tetratricopeptide repeat protein n=1 Tax=Burkholderia sp. WAC0059 TaxID=2066022 RepID=UPI000C7F4A80|nr:tetratricopeptide repeat protein [Burkholderia sp. WAC0059]PLZ04362.1 hypothetical protein CY652_01445 [Burkholderia sp. WAC0059]